MSTKHQPDFESAPAVTSPIFWHFAAKMVPWLLAISVYLVLATLLVRWDMGRTGEEGPDFGAELYGMYTQLFFEPTANLPRAPIARVVFWITPIFGVLLLVRGVVRVGASVFDVEERRKLWVKIMSDRMSNHIVVCGLGHVGIRIVESLKALGIDVIAIERSRVESFAQIAERLAVPVLVGDARRDDLLVQAGIARARAVVCATDDDLTNLEVAIDAKRENPQIRVVMRVFDQRVAGKIGSALALEETFSPAALAGPLVALQALANGVLGVYRVANGELRVDMEISAPKAWWGKTVAECEDAIDGRIVGLAKGERALKRPRHDTAIANGDLITLDVPATSVARLRALDAHGPRDAAAEGHP
ncbi:MAG: TrkA family potassium uptake protein [Labilithrix sp.]|nr:TrkA family potassium uptake protein [Labilithrix sp.]